MPGMRTVLCLLLLWVGVALGASVKVACLHPLLSDMARRVGGEHVQVVNLFPPNAELHAFAPTSAEVSQAVGCRLVLACGKGVEPYLADLRQALTAKVQVLELGADVPDAAAPGGQVTDPHWWNAPENMKRASLALADALKQLDPAHAAEFQAGQVEYARAMDALTRRARVELARIPREQRVLVSAHAAMCHFCDAFRLQPIAAQGVAKESEGDTAHMARLLAELRERGVRCVFTELQDSPKFLENIARQIGAQCRPLVMDGIAPGMGDYESVFLFNLRSLREGLTGQQIDRHENGSTH